MIRAVLDEVVPLDVVLILRNNALYVAPFPDVWRSESDGDVLGKAASLGFDWLVTCDKKMPYQQNLKGLSISVLVLPTSKLAVIERLKSRLGLELARPVPGCFVLLDDTGRQIGEPAPHILGRR